MRKLYDCLEIYCKDRYWFGSFTLLCAAILPAQIYIGNWLGVACSAFCMLSAGLDVRKIWKRQSVKLGLHFEISEADKELLDAIVKRSTKVSA